MNFVECILFLIQLSWDVGVHGALAGTISHKRSVGNKASIQAAHKDKTQSTPALVTDTTLVGFCKAAIKRFLAARAVSRGQG